MQRVTIVVLCLLGTACTEAPLPSAILQAPMPQVFELHAPSVVTYGDLVTFRVSGLPTGQVGYLAWSNGVFGAGDCLDVLNGACADFTPGTSGFRAATAFPPANDSGVATWRLMVPAGALPGTYTFQAAAYPGARRPAVGSNPIQITVVDSDPNERTATGNARYRSLGNTGGEEIYVGVPDLGEAHNRDATDATWVLGANDIMFELDRGEDVIASMNNRAGAWRVIHEVDPVHTLCPADDVDAIVFSIVDRDETGQVDLHDIIIDGTWYGSIFGDGGWNDVSLPVAGLGPSFLVSATVHLGGSFGSSQELSKVEISAACNQAP